jgi:transcriptional regulator with XRE-family HTH domain
VDFKKLGQRFHNARLALELSQKVVAKDLSTKKLICEQSTISRIESGQYTGKFLVLYLSYLIKKSRAAGKEKEVNYHAILDE